MRVLLDTNIIIDRESHNTTSYSVANLYKWLDKLKCVKIIHPRTKEELQKYHDKSLSKTMILKLDSYNELTTNDDYSEDFISVIETYRMDENSVIDNSLLYQLYIQRVDVLITEDRKMRKKAEKLGMKNRTFSINQFITQASEDNPSLIEYKMLAVEKIKFGNVNLSDPFFDSFKEDYGEFTTWFQRKCDEDAYVCKENNRIVGFLYLKTEDQSHDYPDISPSLPKKKRLKIGTFKVEATGFRLGERFLKIIFDNALIQNVDEIYVTLFKQRLSVQRLCDLLERWGFVDYGVKTTVNGTELVMTKIIGEYDNDKTPKHNFPTLRPNPNKFILPIYPKYHTSLFPDAILNNERMDLYKDRLAHRYALQKVYVSAASISGVQPGDLVLIYRTGDTTPKMYSSVLTTVAIVDEVIQVSSQERLVAECQNRSVFTESELRKFYPQYDKIIKLLFYKALTKRVILKTLQDLGMFAFDEGPRPFHKLTDSQFDEILKLANTEI